MSSAAKAAPISPKTKATTGQRGSVSRASTIDIPEGNIKVCVRCRPFSRRELEQNEECCVSMPTTTDVWITDGTHAPKQFHFDRAYWSFDSKSPDFATQSTLMDELGNEQTENVLNGFNACLFAYGQTGSGKTFSVLGCETPADLRGLLPRICDNVFVEIDKRKAATNTTFQLSVTYMEIYNEHLRDLLRPPKSEAVDLAIHQNPTVGIYVQGLTDNPVFKSQDVQQLLDFGMKARSVGATCMNDSSSRSHCIFAIEIKQTTQKDNGVKSNIRCKMNLVDLAGSERQSKTQATGSRLKEGAMINQSLSNLALVISKLAQLSEKKSKGADFVPFRNSKLTYVLQDSLCGNSKTVMIAALSPAKYNADETVSTLRFAESVKCIKTKARKNEETEGALINTLKDELERLKRQVAEGKGGNQELDSVKALVEKYGTNYEDQLSKAQEYEEARAAALADMGLTVGEMAECVGLDKSTPQLVNCGGDPSLQANLVSFVQSGRITIGSSNESGLILKGLGIKEAHALMINDDNVNLTLERVDGRVLVNGHNCCEKTNLRHGDRICFGYAISFRIVIPAASQDIEYYDWERSHLQELLCDALPEGDHRCDMIAMEIEQLENRIGGTRTQIWIQQLQKATAMGDEAAAITSEVRPLMRVEFCVELIDQVYAELGTQPECVIRLKRGEVGAARWRNVVRRNITQKSSKLSSAMGGLFGEGTIGVPPPFMTVCIFTIRQFRERVGRMRKIQEEFRCGRGNQVDFNQNDPWSYIPIEEYGLALSARNAAAPSDDQAMRITTLQQQNIAMHNELQRLNPAVAAKFAPVALDPPRKAANGARGAPRVRPQAESAQAAHLASQLLQSLQDMKRDLRSHSAYVDQIRVQVDNYGGN